MTIPAKGVPAKDIPVRKREVVAAPVVEEVVDTAEEAPKKTAKTTKKAAPKE